MEGQVKSKMEFGKDGGGREVASQKEGLRIEEVLGKLEKKEERKIH